MQVTDKDLFAFGNRAGPRAPRLGQDLKPDPQGMLGAQDRPPWNGPSTFADVSWALLTGHYHRLPLGTTLPEGLGVAADGVDVDPTSPFAPTHHTIYATKQMTYDDFVTLYFGLPWQYGGKK
jgi:hypothetical protein